MSSRGSGYGADGLEGPNGAAAPVIRLLYFNETRSGRLGSARPHRRSHILAGEDAAPARNNANERSCEDGRPGPFGADDVGSLGGNDFVSWSAVGGDGDLVAHGAGRHEQGRLLAHQLGGSFAEPIDAGILAPLLVSHLGFGHGTAHPGSRACRGVADQIDADGR